MQSRKHDREHRTFAPSEEYLSVSEPKNVHDGSARVAASLKYRTFKAGSWTVSGHFLGLILRLLSNIILTRLLAPEMFGIMAIAAVIQVVTSLLADIGIRQAVIQSQNGEKSSFRNTAWTIQVLRGFWIWGVCAVVAVALYGFGEWGWLPPGSVYAASNLPEVIAISALSAVILGFQSINSILMSRQLNLKRLTLLELTAQTAALAVAVLLGLATHSIWSFVASGLVGSALTTLLSHIWLEGPKDRFELNRTDLYELVHFGKWIFLTSAFAVLASNGDRLLLGVWLDPKELGYYSIALNLATVIDGVANRLFSNVSLPALSEVARKQIDRVATIYFRMRVPTDAIFVGMAGFLFATGEWIANFLYDARYSSVGPMLQLLSFGLLFTRYNLAHVVYIALGQPRYVTIIAVTKLISLCVLVPGLFYFFGIRGAIAGVAFHMAPPALWVFWFNWRHGLYDVRLELGALVMWPLGWLAGAAFLAMVHA